MAKAKTTRTTPTPNSNVTSISSASAAPESKRRQPVPAVDVEGEIRQRAYQLYEQRGFVVGHENEDWLMAEREILARSRGQQSA
jgi:hypothetical protein